MEQRNQSTHMAADLFFLLSLSCLVLYASPHVLAVDLPPARDMGDLKPEVRETFDDYPTGTVFPWNQTYTAYPGFTWQVFDNNTANGTGFYDARWTITDTGDPLLGKVVSATDIPPDIMGDLTYTSHLTYTGNTKRITGGVIPPNAHYYVEVLLHLKENSPCYWYNEHILQGVLVPLFNFEVLIHTPDKRYFTPEQIENITWGLLTFTNGPRYATYDCLGGFNNWGKGVTVITSMTGWNWWIRVGLDIDLTTQMVSTYLNGKKIAGPTYVPDIKTYALDPGHRIYTDIEAVQNRLDADDFRIYLLPPVRSNGMPNRNLPPGTSSTEISLTTDRNCRCRYSTTPGTAYHRIANAFDNTGGTFHSTRIDGLADNSRYTVYVRCMTDYGSANWSDYAINVTVGPYQHLLKTGWNSISLPAQPDDPRISSVLSEVLAAENYQNLNLQYWNNENTVGDFTSLQFPYSDISVLDPGKSYWLLLTHSDKAPIRFYGTERTTDFTIPLYRTNGPTWKAFGHLFNHNTLLKNLVITRHYSDGQNESKSFAEAARAGWVDDSFFRFDCERCGYVAAGIGATFEEAYLKPWCGYWILADAGTDSLSITIPANQP